MPDHPRGSEAERHNRYQTPEVATRWIVGSLAGLAGFLALTLVGVWYFFSETVSRPTSPKPTNFAQPRLQRSNGGDDLVRLRTAQIERLTTYAWLDRERGLIRIPIARAMELIAGRGSNGYAPLQEPAAAGAAPSQAGSP